MFNLFTKEAKITDADDERMTDADDERITDVDDAKIDSHSSVNINKNEDTALAKVSGNDNDFIPEEDRLTLTWKGIEVSTKPKGCGRIPGKRILFSVDGIASPCSLMAMIGASGAGKTTLLNILNFRNRTGLTVEGKVMLNGHTVDQKCMSRSSVFVQQDDIFMGGLKVKEHLTFHANLRMKKAKQKERKARVETVLNQLGLKKCEDVKIGKPGMFKGISGGEAKRLAFATEILSKPTLIFCDEPTTGLDSFMARSLVDILKNYAETGRTILCTIHQPSSEIFQLFDQICIMGEGRCIFIGTAKDCLALFKRAGFPCPPSYNPVDHYNFTLAIIPGQEKQCRDRLKKLSEAFENSQENEMIKQKISEQIERPGFSPFDEKKFRLTCNEKFCLFWRQMENIFWRESLELIRGPQAAILRVIMSFFMSLIIGITWFQLDFRQMGTLMSVPGVLFAIDIFVTMSTVMLLILIIPENINILTRDYLSGVYNIPVYYLSVCLFFTIETVITLLIVVNIIYWMVFSHPDGRPQSAGIDNASVYPMILAITLMLTLLGTALGFFASSLTNSFRVATTLVSPIVSLVFLFSGFLIVVKDIPTYFIMFQYLSFYYYALETEMVAVYNGLDAPCKPGSKEEIRGMRRGFMKVEGLEAEKAKAGTAVAKRKIQAEIHLIMDGIRSSLDVNCYSIAHPSNSHSCSNFVQGKDVLRSFDFQPSHVMRNFLAMAAIALGLHLLAICILSAKMHRKRKA